jgi:phosphomannomutase/phosphoglucomutase
VRASNTTPSLVLRFEADDEETLEAIKLKFKQQMLKINAKIELPF